MKELLILLFRPLNLADAWIQPLHPSSFALFGSLSSEERGDPRPLIETVFADGGFEDFILDVGPRVYGISLDTLMRLGEHALTRLHL